MKQKKIFHLICQAHLDPVWIWHRRDGYSEALTTIASAVQFLEEEPDMKFTRSSAAVYRWVKESDPGLFERIRHLVEAGRWEVVNGWEVQPDCNLPLGESFIRQSLYGKRWFRENLGVEVRIGYNVDTFGHAGGLPQILRLSGLDHYVCMRPFSDPGGRPYPNLFWWESPDGSRVLCWRIPHAYGQEPHASADHLEAAIRLEADSNFAEGIRHAPFFLGVGNHGGGPTRRQIDRIRRLQEDGDLPELRFSTMGEYFAAVRAEAGFSRIPVHRGGLQYVNVGCYAAHGRIKKACREAERELLKAECSRSMVRLAGLRGIHETPEEHRCAWRSVLFNQFHDILGGTCLQSADTSILDQFGHASHLAEAGLDRDLHGLARTIDTRFAPKGVLVLFNPLPWEREASAAFDTFVAPTGEEAIT
ncbi:MAG TPA: alpha-mannosidase, partial [Oceanipulchritudo sp.]|nr:alpha-mannosidase [Oceanipulchritudo sp.]